ncbi:hypothetical protein BC834DRAFT_635201 [Gloeopeniophorella convolvens]|nr:hypothetical protein BC834DRAFT_635201 [Gloeopeniophorella convolvens]
MDPPKPPPIATQSLKRKERSPSPERRTPDYASTSGSRPSPTSLPSIRHFLPPQGAQLSERYHPSRQQGPAFSAGPSAGMPRLEFPPPPAPLVEHMHSGMVAADSDGDGDSEKATRPKQKRRRQPLSCTECKRRKIKCDRAHPCTPCIRRGDQNKCQWHVIEPVDKYVSRAEYDELKARVDRLEAMLSRAPPGPSTLTLVTEPSQPPPHAAAGQGPAAPYNPLSPPGQTPAFPAGLAGPSRPQEYGTLRPPSSPARTALPPLASFANGPAQFDGPPRLHPYAPPPLQQPQQTKNCYAQTLTPLGERLRRCTPLQGPAAAPSHPHPCPRARLHRRGAHRPPRAARHLTPAHRIPLPVQHHGARPARNGIDSNPVFWTHRALRR